MRSLELLGKRFGMLLVIRRAASDSKGPSRWVVSCDCGSEKVVVGSSLVQGLTKSCGNCGNRGNGGAVPPSPKFGIENPAFKHGGAIGQRTGAYRTWHAMLQRCTNPNHKNFKKYGGLCCERWKSFEKFLADMGERPEGTSLGRFGDVGNYEPGNCKWMTHAEQEAERAAKRLRKRAA